MPACSDVLTRLHVQLARGSWIPPIGLQRGHQSACERRQCDRGEMCARHGGSALCCVRCVRPCLWRAEAIDKTIGNSRVFIEGNMRRYANGESLRARRTLRTSIICPSARLPACPPAARLARPRVGHACSYRMYAAACRGGMQERKIRSVSPQLPKSHNRTHGSSISSRGVIAQQKKKRPSKCSFAHASRTKPQQSSQNASELNSGGI